MSLVLAPLVFASSVGLAPARRPRTYDLLNVKWQITIDAKDPASIKGTATNLIKLFPKASSATFDCGELVIDGITVNGIKKAFERSGSTVTLNGISAGSRPLAVAIRYHGAPRAGMYFIPAERAYPAKTPVVYTQGEMEDNQHWLPTYDYPDDKATTEGILTLPKGWSALSNGRLVKRLQSSSTETWHWKIDQPHSTYLISFVAGPYTEVVEKPAAPKVSFWVPKGLESMGRTSFLGTARNVEVFGRLTGFPYPYTKYAQSAVPDFMFGGMENITCTTQTIDTLHPDSVHPLEDSTGLVAHELAHQWFGDTVTTPNWSHIWINEGWATFMPSFYVREKEGEDAFHLSRVGTLAGGLGAHENSSRSMIWDGYKDPIEMFDGFAYPGGASRMFMLMRILGEEQFWKTTKAYLNAFKYQNVDTEKFFTFWGKQNGMDLDWFRKQWFYTPAAPKLTVKREGRKWRVEQSEPYFRIPTEVMLINGNEIAIQKLVLNGARTDVTFDADLVQIDPAAWQMANIRYEAGLNANEWMTMWKLARNAGQRARLLDPVFGALNDGQKIEVARMAESSPLLDRIVDRVAEPRFLREMSTHANPEVRRSAVQALGRSKSEEATTARLRQMMSSDANDLVKVAAMRFLYALTKDASIVEKAWLTDSHKEYYRRFAMETWANTEPNRARDLCLAQLRQPRNEALRESAVGILGRLKDKTGSTEVLDALLQIATEPSFGTRSTAMNALANYGDKRAIPVLKKSENHPLVFLRNTAKSALGRLGN
jgi:aminopeptidase N